MQQAFRCWTGTAARTSYVGFIAAIADTSTDGSAVGAAATMSFTSATHSASPVAISLRKDRIRDMDQSTTANADAGERSISRLLRG